MVGDFFREVAALVVVFAFLDQVIFDKPITYLYTVATVVLSGILLAFGVSLEGEEIVDWPFIVLFTFQRFFMPARFCGQKFFFPDPDRAISPQFSKEEERTRIHEQLDQFLSNIQPGLFDKIEDQEKKKPTLAPAFRR
jgi:hypothetical protein